MSEILRAVDQWELIMTSISISTSRRFLNTIKIITTRITQKIRKGAPSKRKKALEK